MTITFTGTGALLALLAAAVHEADAVREAEREAVGEGERDGLNVADIDGEAPAAMPVELVLLGDTLLDAVIDGDVEALLDAERDALSEALTGSAHSRGATSGVKKG